MAQETRRKSTGTARTASAQRSRKDSGAAQSSRRSTGQTRSSASRTAAQSGRSSSRPVSSVSGNGAGNRGRHRSTEYERSGRRPTSSGRGSSNAAYASREDIVLIVLLAVTVFLFLANFRIMGPVGNAVSGVMFGLFGFPNYILPPLTFGLTGFYFARRNDRGTIAKISCSGVLFLVAGMICELAAGNLKSSAGYDPAAIFLRCREGRNGGGLLEGSLTYLLYYFLKQVGTILVLVMIILICALILSGRSLFDMMESSRLHGYDDDGYAEEGSRPYEEEGRRARDIRTWEEEDALAQEEEADKEEYRRLREEDRERRRRDTIRRRQEVEDLRLRREKEREQRRQTQEAWEAEQARKKKQRELEEENRRMADSIVKVRTPGEYENYLANATLSESEPGEQTEQQAGAPGSPSDFGIPGGELTKQAADAATSAGIPGSSQTSESSSTADRLSVVTEVPQYTRNDDTAGEEETAAKTDGESGEEPSQSGAPLAVDNAPGEIQTAKNHDAEQYSVDPWLHEITAGPAAYSAIALKADVREQKAAQAALQYSGIGVPIPQETNPDYTSRAFEEQIIRQGVEEAMQRPAEPASAPASEPDAVPYFAEAAKPADETETVPATVQTAVPDSMQSAGQAGQAEAAPAEEQPAAPDSIQSMEPAGQTETEAAAAEEQPAAPDSIQSMEPADHATGTLAAEQNVDMDSNHASSQTAESASFPASEQAVTTADEQEIEEIEVERERSGGGSPKPGHAMSDPARSQSQEAAAADKPFRSVTSGLTFGGGIAEAQKQRDALEEKIRKQPKAPFQFPPVTLLHEGRHDHSEETDRELKETAFNLQNTLKTFGVDVTIPRVSQGPAVTRYELLPAQGVKVSKIVSLADDIKLNLAASDIRIEAPIPGKQAIGIEVPNRSPSSVPLRELFESEEYQNFHGKIRFGVGKDIGGNVVVADIAKMPHLLIAGSTGSGKSVCINTIILSILYSYTPDQVKLIMIDPKIVELSVYNGIPHLLLPVVTDPKKAAGALQWAVAEMTDRYRRFAEESVRDLKGYNEKARNAHGDAMTPLPQIVIIVDELADLMMVSAKDVEEAICRLAQLARAAGIHLIIATQRPSVDVITGLIKANMPSRIAFAVSSGVDSRTILDMYGAEKLLGKGDMLFYPQGYSKPARVQGAFVSDEEVTDVANYIKYHNQTWVEGNDIEKKIEMMNNGQDSAGPSAMGSAGQDSQYDEHFIEAGYLIIEKKKASIGMLQRVFKIGFNRAARIMDQLCEAGVVSADEGTKARQVLMSQSDFEAYIEENEI